MCSNLTNLPCWAIGHGVQVNPFWSGWIKLSTLNPIKNIVLVFVTSYLYLLYLFPISITWQLVIGSDKFLSLNVPWDDFCFNYLEFSRPKSTTLKGNLHKMNYPGIDKLLAHLLGHSPNHCQPLCAGKIGTLLGVWSLLQNRSPPIGA